ncbi:hypothetical protein N7535_005948 [Penicillium sp. DV-2018c]|nr:hypothetical protein N7461_009526 [Penicillium sp. DV-2018c]KAJ5572288.1 hypothetical protein N7535_005948 [Penicillium sp. DV-2018c]
MASKPSSVVSNCGSVFESNNKLHAHIRDKQHPQDDPAPVAAGEGDDEVQYKPIIPSDNVYPSQAPGQVYKTWRYLSASVGVADRDRIITACIDTGCVMTLIDEKFAMTLNADVKTTTPISVSGIGSIHLSNKYIVIPLYFEGESNVAKLTVEAHLVPDLKATLLIGMGVIASEGFRIDTEERTIRIASCMGIKIPVSVHAKPNHQERRIVRSANHLTIPPRSYAFIDTQTSKLPEDRDYIFQGSHNRLHIYNHLVDANLAWVYASAPVSAIYAGFCGVLLHAYVASCEVLFHWRRLSGRLSPSRSRLLSTGCLPRRLSSLRGTRGSL